MKIEAKPTSYKEKLPKNKRKQQMAEKEIIGILKENWLSAVLAGIGLILVVAGGVVMVKEGRTPSDQEIVIEEETQEGKIKVDIQGAVLNPGVYDLAFSSRVKDLLTVAGGLSEEADRDWVAQNLNQAAKLKDGEKFFIPKKGETQIKGSQSSVVGKININAASASELDSLPDIGKVRSQKIIDDRPYSRIEELLEKKTIPASTFEKIKDKISVY